MFVAAERLHDVSVYVMTHQPSVHFPPSASMLCQKLSGLFPSGETRQIVCSPGLIGRYVYIALPGSGQILTLCEVEVYGLPGKAIMGQQRAGLLIVIILVEIIPCPTPNENFVLNLYSI